MLPSRWFFTLVYLTESSTHSGLAVSNPGTSQRSMTKPVILPTNLFHNSAMVYIKIFIIVFYGIFFISFTQNCRLDESYASRRYKRSFHAGSQIQLGAASIFPRCSRDSGGIIAGLVCWFPIYMFAQTCLFFSASFPPTPCPIARSPPYGGGASVYACLP